MNLVNTTLLVWVPGLAGGASIIAADQHSINASTSA